MPKDLCLIQDLLPLIDKAIDEVNSLIKNYPNIYCYREEKIISSYAKSIAYELKSNNFYFKHLEKYVKDNLRTIFSSKFIEYRV